MKKKLIYILFILLAAPVSIQAGRDTGEPLYNNKKIDGYRGIWFSLGKSEYGYKYSGGLGTYTVKHDPLAVYAEEVNKTFFVYGGTPSVQERRLLCMIGCYDHHTGMISRPTVVFDKETVNDPHDDPTLILDPEGYIWVYVSGRGNGRPGHRYRSLKPYDISGFELINSSIMAYPQPMYIEGEGHFLFFTRYDGRRQLFFQTSKDGRTWSDYRQIASIKDEGEGNSGHYSVSGNRNNKIAIAFNRHPDGRVDYRTNMYYLQTTDFGKTWTTADGRPVGLPVTDRLNASLIIEKESEGKNLYVKDINFTPEGHPVVLYLTSEGWEAGPVNAMRQWYTCYWNGKEWINNPVTTSTHNYDSGSLWITGETWTVIAPTDAGPQKWGTGGEIVSWESLDRGVTWTKKHAYTRDSPRNHGYVRRPVQAKDPFYCMWSDGHADLFSISKLYFGDSEGNMYVMPYAMREDWEKPLKIGREETIVCNADEEIKHIRKNMQAVSLPGKELLVSKFEVTQKQWYAVMGNNPSWFQGETLPVTNVSWNDVQLFIRKLNQLSGLTFRLPTDKEFIDIAEGAATKGKAAGPDAGKTIDDTAWYAENSGSEPHPVGLKQPDKPGIYDMYGNVWEWVGTPGLPGGKAHKLFGGAWNSEAGSCKAGYFNCHSDSFTSYDIGFRLVADINR